MASPGQSSVTNDAVQFDVSGAGALIGAPRDVYDDAVREYAEKLLEEASRLELQHRQQTSSVVQYTTTHVVQAQRFVQEAGAVLTPKPRWLLPFRVASLIMAAIIGLSSSEMTESQPWLISSDAWLMTFLFTLGIAVFLAVMTERGGRR